MSRMHHQSEDDARPQPVLPLSEQQTDLKLEQKFSPSKYRIEHLR